MKYYHLKSIISSAKKTFQLQNPTESFSVARESTDPYIEPEFEKVIYESEQPTILLISAVGASGKSALARTLSAQTKLPLLDLAKHKPVGDNTLTGILTSAYDNRDIGAILEGLSQGTYGLIIDGVDEGRSKTTGKGFEAFLDNIITLCGTSRKTAIVLLGRTQVLDDTWSYLVEKDVNVGLINILPFTINGAKQYIDEYINAAELNQYEQYKKARDTIIDMLGSAFSNNSRRSGDSFESFIGYPPVLDSVVTLLREERNYHKLIEVFQSDNGEHVEITLLNKIVSYILSRERDQKVVPNIVTPLTGDADENTQKNCRENTYLREEQCARLVSYCLGESINLQVCADPKLNEKYQSQLTTWLPEHPFISGKNFRNAVFEAASIATLMTSKKDSLVKLSLRYLKSRKPSYHLVYMTEIASESENRYIPLDALNAIVLSAMEFRSAHAAVDIFIDGGDWREITEDNAKINVKIEIQLGDNDRKSKDFMFSTQASPKDSIKLGPRLAGTFITAPCSVEIRADREVELVAPVEIEARKITIDANTIAVRASFDNDSSTDVILGCSDCSCNVESIDVLGADLTIAVENLDGIVYPAINYAESRNVIPPDHNIKEKYFRLRRILMEFRSHSKGSLAKYRHKIEHERVLRNDLGESILQKLITDGILYREGEFYHINTDNLSKCLDVSWQDLRKGVISDALISYLRDIDG